MKFRTVGRLRSARRLGRLGLAGRARQSPQPPQPRQIAAIVIVGLCLFLLIPRAGLAQSAAEETLAKAARLTESGETLQAIEILEHAISSAETHTLPERHLLAVLLLATNQPKRGLAVVDQALALNPSDRSGWLCLRGQSLMGLGRFRVAATELETALVDKADDAACREALAWAELRGGNPDGALKHASILISDREPSELSASLNALVGVSRAQLGRNELALEPLRAVLAVEPRRAMALLHLGRAYHSLGRFEEASDIYRQGLSFPPPENIRFALGHARSLLRLARLGEAERAIDALIAAHPKVGRAWLLKGMLAFERFEFEDATDSYRKSMELGYREAEASLRLGMAEGMLKRYEAAQTALDQALALDPKLALAVYYKGRFLFEEGETLTESPLEDNPFGHNATRELERSLALDPSPLTSLALAETYLRTGQRNRAIQSAQQAAVATELAPRAHHLAALSYHELLKYDAAESSYLAAIEAGADSVELYHDYGNLLSVMGRWDEAQEVLRRSLERNGAYSPALLQMGIVHLNLRRHEEALRTFSGLVKLEPSNGEAWYQKGIVESRESMTEQAVESWTKALELQPEAPRLYYRLGAELVKLGRIEERNRLLEEFRQRERGVEEAADRDEQLQNLLDASLSTADAGDYQQALSHMRDALALAPDEAEPYVYLSDFYVSQRSLAEAVAVLEQGLKRLPDDLSLLRMLLYVYETAGNRTAQAQTRARIKELVDAKRATP